MPMSPEAKKAASERMKAMHAAKKAEKKTEYKEVQYNGQTFTANGADPVSKVEDEGVRPETTGAQPEQVMPDGYAELLKTVQELQARLDAQPQALQPQQQAQINHAGALVGTFEKYITDPDHYPDPRERLSREPRLAKFAFPLNYELGWEIAVSAYETKQGVHTEEPRFTLELNYIIRDEETDEPTNGRYTLRKAVFHEDPAAAMAVAREQGIPIDRTNQKAFLDEMRYLRMKDWLVEAFYPARPDAKKQAKKQMVFGNRVVEYFEISSTESIGVPFDQLKSKVK